MRTTTFALLIVLTGPAVWAQKYPKRPAGTTPDGQPHAQASLHIRSLKTHPRDVQPAQAALSAVGVTQCHVDPNGVLSGMFVSTATIPSGSTITGSITLLDDDSAIDFTGETFFSSMAPGTVVLLPTISAFGDLFTWNGAALDIAVQVQSGASNIEADCEVLVGEAFSNASLSDSAPLISAVSQRVAANQDLTLVLNGYFTPDTALAVMSDTYSVYLVPPGAINVVSASEVDVDLSQIPGIDLTSSDTLFVTVHQDGFSDTVEYRYLPGTPGTFNLAP